MLIIILSVVSFIYALFIGYCGIKFIRSKEPIKFMIPNKYKDNKIVNVNLWNKEHGVAFLAYSITIILGTILALFIGNNLICLLPIIIVLILPLPFIYINHKKLVDNYIK